MRFLVIGDSKSPPDFNLAGCEFHDLSAQRRSGFRYAKLSPERSYARKNIGYLLAMQGGATLVVETDDDNFPRAGFWKRRERRVRGAIAQGGGWLNVYRYFGDSGMWPRGLPLTEVRKPVPAFETLPRVDADCPIQQGLADENPDVDAVYRLLMPLPQRFRSGRQVILGEGAWCPFNSQNTAWWKDAFPLMYLPAHCPFRMTDIWRSFVAQRIAWANGWAILFHDATVWQERNEHDLLKDFRDEVPGYLMNSAIAERLSNLKLPSGAEALADNMRCCYSALIDIGAVAMDEMGLLEAWLQDTDQMRANARTFAG
jgi:hypothetical protein